MVVQHLAEEVAVIFDNASLVAGSVPLFVLLETVPNLRRHTPKSGTKNYDFIFAFIAVI